MVKLRILLLLPAALVSLAAAIPASTSADAEEKLVGRSVTLAGRKVACGRPTSMSTATCQARAAPATPY